MDTALHLVVKLFISAGLVIVMLGCAWKLKRMWFDKTMVLAQFSYTKDGEPRTEGARRFVEAVSLELRTITDLYAGNEPTIVLPSSNLAGTGPAAFREPLVQQSDVPQIEIEAYGVPVTRVLREFNRFVDARQEIVGSASERSSRIDVFARMRGSNTAASHRGWFIQDSTSVDEAAFELACSIYHDLGSQHQFLEEMNASEFRDFTRALRKYSDYGRALQRPGDEARATQLLEDATNIATKLAHRSPRLVLAHKLRGALAIQTNDAAVAAESVGRYRELLTAHGEKDPELEKLLVAARLTVLPIPVAAAGTPATDTTMTTVTTAATTTDAGTPATPARANLLRPGLSIGLSGRPNSIGTLSCFVRDAEGVVYAITVSHLVTDAKPGDEVIHPAAIDGGTPADTIGEIAYVTPNVPRLTASFALIRLRSDINWRNALPDIGPLRGTADAELGRKVFVFGRTSGKTEGVIDVINLDTKVMMGRGVVASFEGLASATGDSGKGIVKPGDSGAPAVYETGELIGIVFAGSPETTLIMPIRGILQQKNLQLVVN